MRNAVRVLAALVLATAIGVAANIHADKSTRSTPSEKAARKKKEEANRKRLEERAKRARENKKDNEQLGKDIAALMERWAEKRGFSGSVLVAKDGAVIHKAGYGFADVGAKRKNDTATLFDMGSVGKLFTAAAILKLEEQGKLKLTDTLDKFFPKAPKDKAKITLTQLLSHSGGISRDYDAYGGNLKDRDASMNELLAIELSSKPGTKFEYSNANYYLAGAVVEIASRQSYESYLEKYLFAPAGMKDTGFCSDKDLDKARSARRYEDGKDKGSVVEWPFTWGQRGCGYIVTTVEDMFKWSTALEDETVLTEESKEKFFKPQLDGYALGWFTLVGRHNAAVMYHGGAAPGARAFFARYPGDDFMFVFFINSFKTGEALEFELWPELEMTIQASLKDN